MSEGGGRREREAGRAVRGRPQHVCLRAHCARAWQRGKWRSAAAKKAAFAALRAEREADFGGLRGEVEVDAAVRVGLRQVGFHPEVRELEPPQTRRQDRETPRRETLDRGAGAWRARSGQAHAPTRSRA